MWYTKALVISAILLTSGGGEEVSKDKPWTNSRLPGNLVPSGYEVELRPVLTKNAEGIYLFWGSSSVTYMCEIPTKYVILHSYKLNYTDDQISLKNYEKDQDVVISHVFFHDENQYVIVETEKECTRGQQYKLTFKNFVSVLENDLYGFYMVEYKDENGNMKAVASTQMEATGARKAFPCFDEPALKATFKITIWYKANTGYFALSNMPATRHQLKEKIIDGDLWKSTRFEETVVMPTYLLAFIVSDFSYVESYTESKMGQRRKRIRIFARKSKIEDGQADYASKITPELIDFFEDFFQVKYPLPKLDQFALVDFVGGAMENWGLIVYLEDYILYKKSISSIRDKQNVAATIAHEIAHQWFGNLVSPAWWDDLWLNEGFATYLEYLGANYLQPEWKKMQIFVVEALNAAMTIDALTSSRPLVQPANTPEEISAQFDPISYSKGASVIRMINDFLGENNFVEGLTMYLNNLAFGSATHKDLFQHWDDQAKRGNVQLPTNLVTILETWTLQMGYPLVSVKKTATSNEYEVTQEYFLLDPSATPVDTPGSIKYGYEWFVPFTYKTSSQFGSDELTRSWLEPSSLPLKIKTDDYILANINAAGYYRVNYDDETWGKLIAKLKSPSFKDIPTENRAQLIEDAFALANTGRLDIVVALDLSTYLVNEDEYIPWESFRHNIKKWNTMLGRSPIYGAFLKYIRNLVPYSKENWLEKDKTEAAAIERMKKNVFIGTSCSYGNRDCINKASFLFKRWMKSPNTSRIISNTFRSNVYCTAIREGGVEEWDFAWERYLASTDAHQKNSLKGGLSCSKEPWILARYAGYCLNTSVVGISEIPSCLQSIADSEIGRDIIWPIVVEKWDFFAENYLESNPWFPDIITDSTKRFSTTYDLRQIENFQAAKTNLGSAKRIVEQAIENTKATIKWRKENEDKMGKWLQKHNYIEM